MEQSWWLARLLVAQLFVDMLLLLGLLGMLVGMLLVGPKALLLVGLLVGLLLGEDDTIRSCKHHQSHSRFGYCHSSHRSSHNLVLSQANQLLVPAKLRLVLKNHFQTAQ